MRMKKLSLVKDGTSTLVSVFGINEKNAYTVRKPHRFIVCRGRNLPLLVFKRKKDALDRFYRHIGYLVATGHKVENV